jgi:hypothetical protein
LACLGFVDKSTDGGFSSSLNCSAGNSTRRELIGLVASVFWRSDSMWVCDDSDGSDGSDGDGDSRDGDSRRY